MKNLINLALKFYKTFGGGGGRFYSQHNLHSTDKAVYAESPFYCHYFLVQLYPEL